MTTERRIDKPQISIVIRSGAVTCSDKEDGKKESKSSWVKNIAEKVVVFDIQKEKEVFMEEK